MTYALKNKSGRLTRYGFSCGYVERKEYGRLRVGLEARAASCGAVLRVWTFNTSADVDLSFTTLAEARKAFAAHCKRARVENDAIQARILDEAYEALRDVCEGKY